MLDLNERLRDILLKECPSCLFEEPMSLHTTFRIGGPAAAFACPGDEKELKGLLRLCYREKLPWALLGNGSNLLVSDEGFDGVIISLEKGWSYTRAEKKEVRAGAGQLLGRAARLALEHSLTGMEFAAGIPGTVGGALVMNAGAYGSEIKNILKEAKVMTKEGEVLTLDAEELKLSYRTSCIPARGYLVLEALFSLETGEKEAIEAQMQELAARRRDKQPLEYPSAGSTFKRPEGHFAGKLIEDAGLKGLSVGGAQVSEKHCGFVINRGGATASDVVELCRQVQERVKASSGVELEMEIKRLGHFY